MQISYAQVSQVDGSQILLQQPDAPAKSDLLNPSDWISIGSMTVAICALVLTLYQLWATRRHNRLSVRPNLNVHRTHTESGLTISLQNGGLGPAIIDAITITYQNRAGELFQDRYDEVFSDFSGEVLVTELSRKYSMLPKEEIKIIQLDYQDIVDPRLCSINSSFIENLRVSLRYHSIYKDSILVKNL